MREYTRAPHELRREIQSGLAEIEAAVEDAYALEMQLYDEWCDEQDRFASYERAYWGEALSYASANWSHTLHEGAHG